jgi:hypothetical protein
VKAFLKAPVFLRRFSLPPQVFLTAGFACAAAAFLRAESFLFKTPDKNPFGLI